MTPEGRVKKRIDELLDHIGAYAHKPVQNGMGAPTLDYVCCLRGRYFAIEAKAPGEKLTARQQQTCDRIATAGGSWFCVDGSQQSINEFLLWAGSVP